MLARLGGTGLCWVVLGLGVFSAEAQTPLAFSADGYRWVEFEVTIFRNQFAAALSNEISNRDNLHLAWLPRLRRLSSAAASLAYPFPADEPELSPAPLIPQPLFEPDVEPELPAYSARFSPAVPDAFRITDLARDPYIALSPGQNGFASAERKLESSADYQVLWHEAWRQPLLPRSQVDALLVQAGSTAGNHHELEGSLRFSDNGAGLAQIDLNIWINQFGPQGDSAEEWLLPALPQALQLPPAQTTDNALLLSDTGIAQATESGIELVWQQETTRDIGGTVLYYLDHPVIGVLIQARSYELPVTDLPETAEDF